MGSFSNLKIIIVSLCFLLTGLLVFHQPETGKTEKGCQLATAVNTISGWALLSDSPFATDIVASLDLDAYINRTYTNNGRKVSLYIGYYRSKKKVGAAHSPLVCFPGQGWKLSGGEDKTISAGQNRIDVRMMTASIGSRKELVVYWFQAYDRNFSGTFYQKIYMLWAKLKYSREDNAFVRITVPLNGISAEQGYSLAESFVKSFYPKFLSCIKNT